MCGDDEFPCVSVYVVDDDDNDDDGGGEREEEVHIMMHATKHNCTKKMKIGGEAK